MSMGQESIKDLPPDDRPREKLLRHGPQALSSAELLAILINSGRRGESSLSIARRVLKATTLDRLMKMEAMEMKEILGIPTVASLRIAAAFELSRRAVRQEDIVLSSSSQAGKFFVSILSGYSREVFAAAFMDATNRLISWDILFYGGITGSSVDPRYIFRKAILNGAVGVIIAHNHPSGSNRFSDADIEATKKLVEAGKILDIRILDHILVYGNEWTSMADRGMI